MSTLLNAANPGTGAPKTLIEAITEAMYEEMEADERVFCIGEDIGFYGGVFKATKGLFDRFGGERVIDSPLSESMIIGAGVGAALVGMRPIPEIQFADFITCGIDQIVEQASRIRYRTGGIVDLPGGDPLPLRRRCVGRPVSLAVGRGLVRPHARHQGVRAGVPVRRQGHAQGRDPRPGSRCSSSSTSACTARSRK